MDDVSFNPAALSKLKLRVEKGLLKQNSQDQKNSALKAGRKSSSGSPLKKKGLANGSQSEEGVLSSKVRKQTAKETTANPKTLKGKKTLREHRAPSDAIADNKSQAQNLKEEILALGGDDEDVRLIEDVSSDSEFEEDSSDATDKQLQADLAKFMKDLPFAKTQAEFSADSQSEDELDVSEVDVAAATILKPVSKDSAYGDLLIEPQSEWFKISLLDLPDSVSKRISERAIQELLDHGRDLLKEENKVYARLNSTSSSHKYYQDMMVSGTLTDKISALTLSVQESPIHNQSALESLLALAKKRSRNQAVQVLRALKDLFGAGALLPSDRRLKYFTSQPGLSRLSPKNFDHWHQPQHLPEPLSKQHLLLWAYEDWLKSTYFEIIKVLEIWSNDEITYARLRSVDYICDLLKEKPEQETNLLHLLVNKLGDPDKQVASRVSSHLVQLQIPHPFMKSVIISAIEADILFKQGATWHGKYYAIITLNQTVLNSDQQDVVKRLLDIYFSLFLSLLSDYKDEGPRDVDVKKSRSSAKKGNTAAKSTTKTRGKPMASDTELKEKITSGVLTGINRAFPYTATNDDFFEKHLNTLFKITHSSNFNTSVQALMLLQQLSITHPSASDRFYRTLYESLLDARLLTTSKHTLYINLLYRSMKADTNIKRVQAFVKRLGQIIAMHQPSFVCAIIYLIKDLEDTFPGLRSLIDQPEALDSDEESDADQKTALAYNGKKRDPQFSNADRCCFWEIHQLTTHFHPSVSLFVSNLLSKQKIQSKPDLSLHTLINFLDRFVYRNPKKITDALKGVSLMQPMAIANTSDMLVSGRASGKRKVPALNTTDFARMKDEKVQADEVFFHKYFATRDQGKELAQKRKDKKRKNMESDSEEEEGNEEDIWKALVDSRPELDDVEDDFDDDNDGFSDYGSQGSADIYQEDDFVNEKDGMDLDDDNEDDLLSSDEEIELSASDEELSNSQFAPSASSQGRKRRKLKDLPTFASADEYASVLQNEEDGLSLNLNLEGLDTVSSPPFELPFPELPKKRRNNRRKSKAGGFTTPERSRASDFQTASSHNVQSPPSESSATKNRPGSEYQTPVLTSASKKSYYTAAWGSPYDITSTKASKLAKGRRNSDTIVDRSPSVSRNVRVANPRQPKSAGFLKQNHPNDVSLTAGEGIPSSKVAYDLTGDWIREYHRARVERKTWLSDGSDNSDDSLLASEEELDVWPGHLLPTPEFKVRNRFSPSATPTTRGSGRKHKHFPSDATLTQENFDIGGEQLSERQSKAAKMLSALISGGIPRRERNIESTSEKAVAAAPLNRTASESPINGEQITVPPNLHPKRPSVAGANSFQRPKKKVVWKGKTCTIALPLENVKDHIGNLKKPLTPGDVVERLRTWERSGISIRGFDLSEDYTSDTLAGQSRDVYPDPNDSQNATQKKNFVVRIPDKQWWNEYVRQLQEAKLRALGVTVAGEDIPARSPSVTSSISREPSSHSSYPHNIPGIQSPGMFRNTADRVLSPPGSTPGSQFPFPQSIASPNMSSATPHSAGYHITNQANAFQRDRVFSPFSLAAESASANSGTQYLGSMPNSRGVSPLLDDRRQSIRSLNSPVSPLPEMLQIAHLKEQVNHPLFSRQQSQPSPILPHDHANLLQQEVSKNLAEQMPAQFFSQPEIASPFPQGRSHRHNVSQSLQKEIDEAEYHLETSIARQLNDPDEVSERGNSMERKLLPSHEELQHGNLQEKPTKSVSVVSDIETNPSQGNSPIITTMQPLSIKNREKKTSISKLNVNAQEFVFNPAKAAFTPMFTFGEKPPTAPLSAASISGSSLNVAAPAFVPGKPFEPSPRRVFSFSSNVANPQPDIPTFTPGAVFGEIPGGLMDKRPGATQAFTRGSTIQLPKKTKAVPIVRPESEDDAPEDDEGRPMQDESRQKRARRSGGSGDETPLFAAPREITETQSKIVNPVKGSTKEVLTESISGSGAEINQVAQNEPENIALKNKHTTTSKEGLSMDKTSTSMPLDVPDISPEVIVQKPDGPIVPNPEIGNEVEDVDQDQPIPSAVEENLSGKAVIEPSIHPSGAIAQDQDLPQVSKELKNEKTGMADSSATSTKPSGLIPPSPLQQIPSSPVNVTDTALNTADFLKTPANVTSPVEKERLEEQFSVASDPAPSYTPPRENVQIVSSVEDPFTIGDHDDGNITDKSTNENQTTSFKLNPREEAAKIEKLTGVPADHSRVEQKSPDITFKKSTLSATAKPFIFNPSVSDFKPESIKQQPILPTTPSKQDTASSEPQTSAQAMPKNQSTAIHLEHPAPRPIMQDVTASTNEPPAKNLAFSGGLGASRYAPQQPAQSSAQPSPLSRASASPSQPEQADIKQEERLNTQYRPTTPERTTPPVEQSQRRVSSPDLSPLAKEPYQPSTERYRTPPRRSEPLSMEERITSGVKYVEPSFNEIDDVMRQLNGDDSDAGVERDPEQVWRSPRAADRKNTKSPDRIATPQSERPSPRPSRLPTASPNHLDRPFQYLPNQDYGSSNTEDSKLRDAAAEMVARNARFSPSFKGQHHVKLGISPVHKLKRRTSSSISNWDDVVSSGEETDFHHRVGFFDNRVGHVITNAMDDRLQPIEATLAELTTTLSKLSERSRSGRSRPSQSVQSDADDEDDETGVVRAVSPFMKDRRFEKLRSILLDAVVQQNAPHEELSKIIESIADLKTELGKKQEPSTLERDDSSQAISKLMETVVEIKTALSSQQVNNKHKEDTTVMPLEHISTLTRTITELQTSLDSHQQPNPAAIETIIETAVKKHLRGQSTTIKSSQESAAVEKLQLQLTGLESLLKDAEERATEEHRLRRSVEDQLVESERELKSAVAEAAHQRDAAEETERSLQSIVNDHRHHKERTARLEEIKIELDENNFDLQAKNKALEDTLAEYRISHHEWRKDLDVANAENQELVRSIKSLRKELEEGIASRHALKEKFERIENEMLAARHSIARDQAMWRHKEEEHKAKHELSRTRLEAEARTRERLELEVERLEKQEQDALRARSLVENIQSQNNGLANIIEDLRVKENSAQERSVVLARELHDVKERSHLETQRLMSITQSNIESSNQQIQILRADLEGVIHRLEDQLQHSQSDAKNTKERYQALLEEASISRDTALREAAEAREAALQEHYRFHERTIHESQVSHERVLSELKADHARAVANTHEDHERTVNSLIEDHNRSIATAVQEKRINEQDFNGRLALSNDKILHLQDKVQHLEDKLTIATSAAQAAAEAAKSARNNPISSPASNTNAPSLRGFDPQALRQTVETLQDQLGERERQIEKLEQQLEDVDMEAPSKVKERDAEITWLRELLGVRMDDMQDIIVQLSTPRFDRAAVRDAVIRLRTNLQMEQQERERQLNGVKFPSLSDIRASPKALPLAAAAAWGSWRKGQTSLSSLAEMAVPSGSSSTDQTPSKSSPQSFLSGLLTPPNTNMRQTPSRGSPSLSRSARTSQRPLAAYSTPKRQISVGYDAQQETQEDVPETPALLTQGSYDADAPEGSHHYSLEQYVSEQADLPSEDASQQDDNDSLNIIHKDEDADQTSNPFGPSIELAG